MHVFRNKVALTCNKISARYIKFWHGNRIYRTLTPEHSDTLSLNFIHRHRVADPVHFRPDPAPDPANQNFKIGSGSYWHLKNQFKHLNFFSHQTYFFWYLNDYFFLKKFTWKCVKPLFLKYIFLVYKTLHCQSTDRIRIRWKLSGSGSGSAKKVRIRNPA